MKRRVLAVGCVLAVVAGVAWLLIPPERRPLRPSETMRALRARLDRPRPRPVTPDPVPRPVPRIQAPPPPGEPLTLRIELRRSWEPDVELDDSWYVLSLPESYWPHTDEVDWPDLPSVDGLQSLADRGIELAMRQNAPFLSEPNETWIAGRAEVESMLDQAEQDGLFAPEPVWDRPHAEDPWALLHQAQVHRAAELLTSFEGRPRASFARGYLAETRFLAHQLVDRDPEHPAADYARLMLLEAATSDTDAEFKLREPQLAVDTIVQTLEASDDPLVSQSAMVSLLMVDADDLARADVGPLLDRLEAEVDTLPNDLREAVAAASLGLAIQTDPSRAGVWMQLLEDADPDREGAVVPRSELDEALGRLAQQGARPPSTWAEELQVRAAACHRDAPLPRAIYTLTGRWEQGWQLEDTSKEALPTGWIGCLSAGSYTRVPPADALALTVSGSVGWF